MIMIYEGSQWTDFTASYLYEIPHLQTISEVSVDCGFPRTVSILSGFQYCFPARRKNGHVYNLAPSFVQYDLLYVSWAERKRP